MAKIQIGKVAITHDGVYDSRKTYARNTCVFYNGSTYITLKDGVVGVDPIDDGINWHLMAAMGERGLAGRDGSVAFASLTETQRDSLKGEKGDAGAVYIPLLNAAGDLSWTNNGGLPNPGIVNLKGEKGEKGDKGSPGAMFQLKVEDGRLVAYTTDATYDGMFVLDSDGHLYCNFDEE